MSHELRTPLNGILGMTNLAMMENIPGQAREYLQMSLQAGQNLLSIVNDVLDLSTIEAGQVTLDLTVFDLRECLEEVLTVHAQNAGEKGVRFLHALAPDVPERVEADRVMLSQVLSKLADNAVKFTHKGYVNVTVGLVQEPGESEPSLLFQVVDTGVGIPSDKLGEVFEKFAQADSSSTRRFGGTGLGLTIARNLVRLMGGRMWVESEEGRGATFGFTIQLRPTPA